MTAPQPGEIEVEDQLERRIRKPVDLLRCVVSCTGIVALAVAGIAASATMSGTETGIVGASRRLPHALVMLTSTLALFAIGSIIPTPGGIGGVEAALTAGLTAAGVPGAAAASAVLLFRLLTFWLPVPFGWGALKYLEREQAL